MSNELHTWMPGWCGPVVTGWVLRDLFQGWDPPVSVDPRPTHCPQLGCILDIRLSPAAETTVFVAGEGDAYGRRLLTVHDRPLNRAIVTRLVDVVGGTVTSEYQREPMYARRPVRPRLDLNRDEGYRWLKRRIARMRFADPAELLRLAPLD